MMRGRTHNTQVLLSRRRMRRAGILVFLVGLGSLVFLDHAGVFGYAGNDWATFHQKSISVTRVIQADRLLIADGTTVQLLGVTPADYGWADWGKTYLSNRLEGKLITLRLEPTQTRDASGRLLAFVYSTDSDLINLDIVHDGQAFADRRVKYSLHQQIEQAENEARKKQRGMWKELDWNDLPKWRQDWVKSLARRSTK